MKENSVSAATGTLHRQPTIKEALRRSVVSWRREIRKGRSSPFVEQQFREAAWLKNLPGIMSNLEAFLSSGGGSRSRQLGFDRFRLRSSPALCRAVLRERLCP